MIYLFDRDYTYEPKEDFTKAKIQTSSNNGNKSNFVFKSDVICKMQNLVEDFDFQQKYKNTSAISRESEQHILFENKPEDIFNLISYKQRIYDFEHKQDNFAVAFYKNNDKSINPRLMLRFDAKQIVAMQVLRLPNVLGANDVAAATPDGSDSSSTQERTILFLIAASNDNYIRFFNLKKMSMPLTFKAQDYNGCPLSFDVSPDR